MNSTAGCERLTDTVTDAFMKNEDDSDELFSDDESKEISYRSDISLDTSILRSKTPLLPIDNSNTITPSAAVIPSTPLSLVPFLNKINEQWTSDLETPQADKTVQLQTRPLASGLKNAGETPKFEQYSPEVSSAKSIDNKITSDSPVIVSRMVRKRPKRRCIFRSSICTNISDDISNKYAAVNRQEDVLSATMNNTNLVAQSNTTNVMELIPHIDNAHDHYISQVHDRTQEICDKNFNQLRDFVPDTLELSEELFNASFNDMDKSVVNNLNNQATIDTTVQDNSKQNITNTYRKESPILNLNKVKEKESTDFYAACGTTINVSKKALFKMKTPSADEMQIENRELYDSKGPIEQKDKHLSLFSEILPELQFTEYSKNYNKMCIIDGKQLNESSDQKDIMLPFPHSDQKVYEKTSSKVKLSFARKLDESLQLNVVEETHAYNKENKLKKIKNPSIGFQTAHGKPINISKQALSKAKLLLAKELDESFENNIAEETDTHNKENRLQEIKNSSIGFQTARGAPINISKQALSKAKLLFAKELDESLESNISEEINTNNEAVKGQDVKTPNIGFQTARGAPINISKQALSKAELLFAKELDKPLEPNISKEINTNNEAIKEQEVNAPNIGFQTARGAPINISKQALSKAKLLFAKESDEPLEPNISEEINTNNEAVKGQEVKTPNIGFHTARGAPINISKQALSKAKLLFAKESDEPLEPNISEEINTNNETVKGQEVKTPNIGFQTARGAPINISKQALSKAELLFAKELDKPLEPNISKEINTNNEAIKEQEVNAPNIGFQTARGAPINISKQALSKAKLLFAKESDEPLEPNISEEINTNNEAVKGQEVKTPNIGFHTARGASINISKQALSKAKLLFAKELDEPLEPNMFKEINTSNEAVKEQEVNTPNIGFQTARGASINISKQALSKAKLLFAKELDEPLEPNISEEVNTNDETIKRQKVKSPIIGFQTAHGVPINISNQALSRAKSLFAKELDEPLKDNVVQVANIQDEEMTTPNIEFQSVRDRSINVSKQTLSRIKLSVAKKLDESSELSIVERSNSYNEAVRGQDTNVSDIGFRIRDAAIGISEQAFSKTQTLLADQLDSPTKCSLPKKRKLSSDDSTPLSRDFASGWKKVRLSNEFEGRKLFPDYPNIDIDDDEMKTPLEDSHVAGKMSTDDDADDRRTEALHITELSTKIAASHMEHPEEKNQEDPAIDPSLRSPKRETSELPESNAMGSPVIGRRPVSRKRWSLEQRKSKQSATQLDQITQGDANTAPCENAPARCEEIDEKESQKTTQTDRQKVESISESADYGDTQMMMDFIDESVQILQDRLVAALKQEKTITEKRRHRSKQSAGYLYRFKQINSGARFSLRDISKGASPTPRTYQELVDQRIPPNILAISAETAVSYKLRCSDFYGSDVARSNVHGLELEDGARLIMDENGYVGVWEFLPAFLASPGVDPNLVPARWIENHYRWIVWKLASMDRMKFSSTELPRALTPSHVMAQLKYRYDREIDRSQRPAIRRILEKDDVASKRMILCVSTIVENSVVTNITTEMGKSPRVGVAKWKIELTDGWYSIPVCIDLGMMKHVSTGKVREGTKLLMYGAELLKCDVACHPLEAPADVCLKLHTNSTRRARWDSKLGYAPRSGPIPVRLCDVCPNGGFIGRMTIVVARVYPMLFHEKSPSGESVLRNAKSEEKAQTEYEQRCRRKADAFYDKAEEDFQEEDLSCETDLLAARSDKDRESSTQEFSGKKRRDELLREMHMKKERYKQQMQSKLRESLPAPRQVSPLLKVRVCDGDANAILSIWSPGEEVVDVLKEGACVSLRNVTAAGKRGCELQLTARRCALFNPGTMRDTSYPPRVCASLHELGSLEFSPPYGEFDTVGLVCAVGTAPYGMKDFEVVHLACPKSDSSHSSSYLSIMFWQGIANYGYAEILTVGSIVACCNLEWRRAISWNVPVAYCADKSTFTRNPRRNHLYEAFESLRDLIANPIEYAEGCNAELNMELQKKSATTRTPTRYAPDRNTPIKIHNPALDSDRRPIDYTTPMSKSIAVSNSWNYTASSSSMQKRLDKLQHYAEPPGLSPIVMRSSKRVFLDYRSPVRVSDTTLTDSSSSVKSGSSNSCLSSEKQ